MANVTFVLKEPNSKKETLIYMMFSFDNMRLKISTGEKILPFFWNSSKNRAKESKQFPEYPEFNSFLDKLESDVKNIYRKLKNENITPTIDLLKHHLNNERNNILDSKISFRNFANNYIEESKNNKAKSTVVTYKTCLDHLDRFSQENKIPLEFESINVDFYNKFIVYLNKNNLSQNTVGKQIKILKAFLNEATERDINTNLDFRKKKFKKLTEETDKIYLSIQEIEKIYSIKLHNHRKYDIARDLFIIGCCTGLRFSDFSQLIKENIIENNKLKLKTQKTGETVVIPLHKYVLEIFKKYNGELPRVISNQKLNEYIKLICKIAKIKEMTETSITKGGKLEKQISPKYMLVSTHTARRSFATNLFLADVSSITIMKITGHKTEKSFLRYIRISQEENANKLLNHPFFKI
ncbi:MAG: site-specific integrase [Bacteroidetes bacterium]|nr:site-specific integrase [Bacteroidota bacterium]